jgi:hypothetical protein
MIHSRTTQLYLDAKSIEDLESISKIAFNHIVKYNPEVNKSRLLWHLGYISFIRLTSAYSEDDIEMDSYSETMLNFANQADLFFKDFKGPNNAT